MFFVMIILTNGVKSVMKEVNSLLSDSRFGLLQVFALHSATKICFLFDLSISFEKLLHK